jgi:hypothetical protein
MKNLYQDAESKVDFGRFISFMDQNNYRKDDKFAIKQLFVYIKEHHKALYNNVLVPIKEIKQVIEFENADEFIYKTRNDIVHLSFTAASAPKYVIQERQWDQLIVSMIPLLKIWYQAIEKIFDNGAAARL